VLRFCRRGGFATDSGTNSRAIREEARRYATFLGGVPATTPEIGPETWISLWLALKGLMGTIARAKGVNETAFYDKWDAQERAGPWMKPAAFFRRTVPRDSVTGTKLTATVAETALAEAACQQQSGPRSTNAFTS